MHSFWMNEEVSTCLQYIEDTSSTCLLPNAYFAPRESRSIPRVLQQLVIMGLQHMHPHLAQPPSQNSAAYNALKTTPYLLHTAAQDLLTCKSMLQSHVYLFHQILYLANAAMRTLQPHHSGALEEAFIGSFAP